jgi:hypothetical protein
MHKRTKEKEPDGSLLDSSAVALGSYGQPFLDSPIIQEYSKKAKCIYYIFLNLR